jgi:hypothetical protein
MNTTGYYMSFAIDLLGSLCVAEGIVAITVPLLRKQGAAASSGCC